MFLGYYLPIQLLSESLSSVCDDRVLDFSPCSDPSHKLRDVAITFSNARINKPTRLSGCNLATNTAASLCIHYNKHLTTSITN